LQFTTNLIRVEFRHIFFSNGSVSATVKDEKKITERLSRRQRLAREEPVSISCAAFNFLLFSRCFLNKFPVRSRNN